MSRRLDRPLTALLLLGLFGALIAVRRPDVITRPQFYAEDGMEWYARAYNSSAPWQTATTPYGGYLQTFPRLVALASQLVDLRFAPLLLIACAILIQALVPLFLLSSRFEAVIPGRWRRLAVGLILLAAPNLMEVHANVTNSHVHLAMLAFLVLIATPRRSFAWRTFDVVCLLLSGLSGPFCILLVPVALVWWLHERSRWSLARLLIVVAATAAQIAVLSRLVGKSRGWQRALDASLANFLDIVGGQIFVGGSTGVWTYATLRAQWFADHPWLPLAIGVLGIAFVVRAAIVTTSFALRTFLLFAVLHLAAALRSPIIFGDRSVWQMLALPGAGQRYYYFAILAFLATLLWTVAADRNRVLRGCAAVVLAVTVLVGMRGDWRIPPFSDMDFAAQVERFHGARAGESIQLAIVPEPWTMQLVKR